MENSQGTGAGLLLAGRYRLTESIGQGGMGRVWRAHDELLNRVVAIKELTAGVYGSEADRGRLHARTRTEARAAARISHPGAVTVHDVLDHDQRPWIVMQYVDGHSLADALATSGRITPVEAARIGLQVLGALDAAHRAGVLHRDVKPANILLGADGRVLLTDFGIAAIEGDSTITRTGEIVGSVEYLAPERAWGQDPGPSSDLWSLGATLYTAVEGESPFRRSSPLTTLQAVVTDEVRPPHTAGPLTAVILALLQKDPGARPSVTHVAGMFRSVAEGRAANMTGSATNMTGSAADLSGSAADLSTHPTGSTTAAPTHPTGSATAAPTRPTESTGFAPTGLTVPLPASTGNVGGPAPGFAEPPTMAGGQVAPHTPAPPPRRRKGLILTATAASLVLAALIALGVRYAITNGQEDGSSANGGTKGGSAAPGASGASNRPAAERDGGEGGKAKGTKPSVGARSPGTSSGTLPDGGGDTVPRGWQRVQDPAGFSLLIPEGWTRTTSKGQIDYSPDNGLHRLRIGINRAPDFDHPYRHLLSLEKQLRRKLPDYQRLMLDSNSYRDYRKSARWEFSWTEKQPFAGPRRAIDQMYYDEKGVEYALYLDGPEEDWQEMRQQFQTVIQGWRPPR
ncbi:protein kinase [Streptomyces sp. NPDC057638]|uniref:serine/threonine-protein kinase n=1 Tax=Streptomyces sp. NPDC057638 TaxID=3346190 RepID=UPI0036766CD5